MNESICEICGAGFIKNSNSQKYCGSECARIAKMEQDRNARLKYKLTWHIRQFGNGTGALGCHRDNDFIKEMELVRKEKERCGLL